MMKGRVDWFLVGIVAASGLAWVSPGPGARGGILHPELLTKGGIALIFFLHGLALSFSALKAGTLRWPLHLVVQVSTFLVFPVLGLAVLRVVGEWVPHDLRIGFFYLCALPSTVSSSVAMTAAARGNVPAAIFNATLSSLLGVVLTPLWIRWMMSSGGELMPIGEVIVDLLVWLVLPLVVGQAFRPLLGGWAGRHKRFINTADKLTILLLVYTSLCDAVRQGVWTKNGASVLAALAGSVVLLFTMLALVGKVCDLLEFNSQDRSAAVFCGSKKTLASGVPMAHLIFGSGPSLGLILLPIMVYHSLQLVVCGILAGRWAREAGGFSEGDGGADFETRGAESSRPAIACGAPVSEKSV